jgi:hypothetical protein
MSKKSYNQATNMKLLSSFLIASLPFIVSANTSKLYPQRPYQDLQSQYRSDQHHHTKQDETNYGDRQSVDNYPIEDGRSHAAPPKMGIRTRVTTTTVYEGVIATVTVTEFPLETSEIESFPAIATSNQAIKTFVIPLATTPISGSSTINPLNGTSQTSRLGSSVSRAPSPSPVCLNALPPACQLSYKNLDLSGRPISVRGECGIHVCLGSPFGPCCGSKGTCGRTIECEEGCQVRAGFCLLPISAANIVPVNIDTCFAALRNVVGAPKATALRTTCATGERTTSDPGFVTCLNQNLSFCRPCLSDLPPQCLSSSGADGADCLKALSVTDRIAAQTCIKTSGPVLFLQEICIRRSLRFCLYYFG